MAPWYDGPLVGLDFETTGVDPSSDLPVQVALVAFDGRRWGERSVFIVDPGREVPEAAVAVHGISTARARREGLSLDETARRVHRGLKRAVNEAIPLVAMNASFDVTIAAVLFERAGLSPLCFDRVIDPLVIDRRVDPRRAGKRRLDALCAHYGVLLEGAHDAGQDAAAAVALAREIGRRFPEAGGLDPLRLTALQAGWHREWAVDFHAWCLSEGRPGLAPEEYLWPVRLGPRPPAQSEREPSTMSMSSSEERGFTTASRMAGAPSWVVGTTKAVPLESSAADHS